MSIRITLPTGMELLDWSSQLALDLDNFGPPEKLINELEWQDWATQFVGGLSMEDTIPIPYQFSDWREWAERFCQAVE